ncbi:DUF5667 domain-containing protein [Candidatus Aquicultor secundus]|uniref:DUF5667 domain-containing protein n=1 Tax=Candidatus Aquicultor secundus TaxID=1973895 RepID=UPI002580F7BE|nr:DUF5667 domain-containing protein [Candidatus Aquicultor secundus]
MRLYPNQRRELKGLLEVAVSVKTAYPAYPELRPSKLYTKIGREKFLAAIENGMPAIQELTRVKETPHPAPFDIKNSFRKAYVLTTAAAAAMVILVGSLVYVSSDTLPGNPLYALKRATESAQLALTFDSKAKAKLHYEIAEKRIAEARQVEKAGEKDAATAIYKDAQQSLTEAEKIAKAEPNNSKDKLDGAIKSINKKLEDEIKGSPENKALNSEYKNPSTEAGTISHGLAKNTDTGLETDEKESYGTRDNATTGEPEKQRKDTLIGSNTVSARKSVASISQFEVDAMSVSDEYISPNGDCIKDTITVGIKGASADGYNIALYKGKERIATIAERRLGRNSKFIWDGNDISGRQIPDGKYILVAENSIDQIAHVKARVIVDTKDPRVKLIEPSDEVSTINGKLQFVWNIEEDVSACTLYISSEENQRVMVVSGITGDSYQLDKELGSGKWKWRVVAIDRAGNVEPSSYGYFTIERSTTNLNQGAD